MTTLTRASLSALSLAGLLLVTGCTTQADIDALRVDIVKAQETAASAEKTAASAERRATQAEAAAKAAAEKADRIYRESLRK